MKVIQRNEHRTIEYDWLTTTHHFSFGEYYNPQRMNFGPLRVFNDDVIKLGSGFDFHRHQDMEIVTYVVSGILEHKDNFGNHGIIQAGEIQRMSAGTGVFHSEYNHSAEMPLRLLQMWVFANRRDLKPSWEQQKFSKKERQNKLLQVISPIKSEGKSLSINQDVSFYVSNLITGNVIKHNNHENRQIYLYVIQGQIKANDQHMSEGDSAEAEESEISIIATKDSEIIMLDLPVRYTKNA